MSGELIRSLRSVDIPVLRNSEVEFLELLNSEIETIITARQGNNEPNNEAILSLVATVEENLISIIRNLNGGRTSRHQFCSGYPKWKKCREDGIQKLTEIAKSIDKDRFNCNVSKIFGYSTSLIGGGVGVGSAIVGITAAVTLAMPLAIAGAVVTGVGVATSFGTSAVETALLKNSVKNANKVIEKDKKYFQKLNAWLTHAEDLQKAMEAVMGIDIVKELSKPVKDLVDKALKIPRQLEKIRHVQNALGKIFDSIPRQAAREVPLREAGILLIALAAIYLLFQHGDNRLTFDFAALTLRSLVGIVSLLDDTMDCVRLSSLLLRAAGGDALKAAQLATAVTRGAVAVVGIVLDVAGIVLASIDLKNGSRSPQAEHIFELVEEMRNEANLFEELFKKLSDV